MISYYKHAIPFPIFIGTGSTVTLKTSKPPTANCQLRLPTAHCHCLLHFVFLLLYFLFYQTLRVWVNFFLKAISHLDIRRDLTRIGAPFSPEAPAGEGLGMRAYDEAHTRCDCFRWSKWRLRGISYFRQKTENSKLPTATAYCTSYFYFCIFHLIKALQVWVDIRFMNKSGLAELVSASHHKDY